MPIEYKNLGGNSGVEMYETGSDYIKVWFLGCPKVYVYTNESAGKANITEAKRLAEAGKGLNSFIMLRIRDKYTGTEPRDEWPRN